MGEGRTALTFKSVSASLMTMFFVGMLVQFMALISGADTPIGQDPLTGPVVVMVALFILLSALSYGVSRLRLFTREELTFILYVGLLSVPLMYSGFWRGFFPLTTVIVRKEYFQKYDVLNDRLWPKGENLTKGVLKEGNKDNLIATGEVDWIDFPISDGTRIAAPRLRIQRPGEKATLRIVLPLANPSRQGVKPNDTYLLTVLARAAHLGPSSSYFCRLYYDDAALFASEAFIRRIEEKKTFIQKEGFIRMGRNDVAIPPSVKKNVTLELGLQGPGEVVFRDLQFIDINALELALKGRSIVTRRQYERLPKSLRANLVVKPDRLFSLEGFRFLLSGFVPFRDWLTPIATWGSFAFLILAGSFGVILIMRKQWIDNERYPLPLLQIPLTLLGGEEGPSPFASIWRDRLFWTGFGLSLLWCMMKGYYGANPNAPNIRIALPLDPFFDRTTFGNMWNDQYFTLSALVLSLAAFMDVNVSASIVIGYFLFRAQSWYGHAQGLSIRGYPYQDEQGLFGYLVYAAIIIFLSRKYILRALRNAIRGKEAEGGFFSQRTGFLFFLLSAGGALSWAFWTGISLKPVLLLFFIMLSLTFVAAKIRAECGIPHSVLYPSMLATLVPFLGGMAFNGAEGSLFMTLFLTLLVARANFTLFFMLPGLQLEFLEAGRRLHIKAGHLAVALSLSLLGGFLIGGWTNFQLIYAQGAEKLGGRVGFDYREDFKAFNRDLAANSEKSSGKADRQRAEEKEKGLKPRQWAYLYAGGVTAVLTLLRQAFAGFWFHPIGFLFGYTSAAPRVWSSILVAALIRFTVVKLGGARAVKEKLQPFFTGVFLAAAASQTFYILLEAAYYLGGVDINYGWGQFPL